MFKNLIIKNSIKIKNWKLKIILTLLMFIGALVIAPSAYAANFYWVGNSGNWSDYSHHWATTDGGGAFRANAPTSADDVFFTNNSFTLDNQTVTQDVAIGVCKTMTWTGVTHTPRLDLGTTNEFRPYGNVTFDVGMSVVNTGLYGFAFQGNATLLTAGITLPCDVEASSGSTLNLGDDFNNAGHSLYANNGSTLNTNGHTVYTGSLITNQAGTCYLNITNSTIYVNVGVNFTSTSSLNFTKTGSTINMTGTSSFSGNGYTFNIVNFNGTAHTISGNNNYTTLTFADTSAAQAITMTANSTQTVTGTFTATGYQTGNRVSMVSSSPATRYTISAGTVSVTKATISDLTGSGTGSWAFGTSADVLQGANSCSGLTFSLFWYKDNGNWSSISQWSSVSGQTANAVVIPDSNTNVYFDANSFTAISQAVTVDVTGVSIHNMDWTGAGTYGPEIKDNGVGKTMTVKGNFTLVSEMTWNGSGGVQLVFSAVDSSTYNIDAKNVNLRSVQMTGNYQLLSNFMMSSNSIIITSGTLTTNGYAMTALRWTFASGITLNLGSSTITAGSGYEWNYSDVAFNLNAGTSTIIVTGTGGTGVFYGHGNTYYNVQLNGATNTIAGSNTFNDLKLNKSGVQTITFTDGTIQRVTTFTRDAGTSVKTLQGSSTGGWGITKLGGGTMNLDYLNITYSAALPLNAWAAGTHSTDSLHNSGWVFATSPLSIIAGKGQDAYQLQIDGSRNVTGYVSGSASGSTIMPSGWHHVTMIYDGVNIKIYVDGVLKVTTPKTGAIGTNGNKLEIGSGIAGKLDNVKIYNRALSSAEVLAASESYNPAVQVSDLQKGLVGNWKFNGNAKDSTPNRNNGTITGTVLPTTDRKGQVDRAYSFATGSNYINFGNQASLTSNLLSVAVWVKTDRNEDIIHKYSATPGIKSWWFGTSGGKALFQVTVDGTNMVSVTGNTNIIDNNWHHIVGTFNGSQLNIYVDENVDKTPVNLSGSISSSSQNVYMCSSWISGSCSGSLDDVHIYNRALSAIEVSSLYQEYDPGMQVSNLQKGLVGQWKMDSNAKDSTPNRNHGTVTGATLTTDRKGQANKAYSFNSANSNYISIAQGVLAGLANFSISVWIYPTAGTSHGILTETYTGLQMGVYYGNNNIELMVQSSSSNNVIKYTSTDTVTLNQWHHIVGVKNGTAGAIYIDGVSMSLGSEGAFPSTVYSTAATPQIGRYAGANYYAGSIDDVRIYSRALSPTEVTALYESY